MFMLTSEKSVDILLIAADLQEHPRLLLAVGTEFAQGKVINIPLIRTLIGLKWQKVLTKIKIKTWLSGKP